MARNVARGTVECPHKGCTLEVPVFQFRSRSENPKLRRMGGKFYVECPEHGRWITQEWVLENVKWLDEKASAGAPAKTPEPAPAAPMKAAPVAVSKTPEKPAPAPVAKAPEKSTETPAAPVKKRGILDLYWE